MLEAIESGAVKFVDFDNKNIKSISTDTLQYLKQKKGLK